jgi:hypothetical protein
VLIVYPFGVGTGASSTDTTEKSQAGTPSAVRSTPKPSHATPSSNGVTPGTITAATDFSAMAHSMPRHWQKFNA